MTTTASPTALVPVAPVFPNTERLALAGFLAGYGGLTREAYELDPRQWTCSPAYRADSRAAGAAVVPARSRTSRQRWAWPARPAIAATSARARQCG